MQDCFAWTKLPHSQAQTREEGWRASQFVHSAPFSQDTAVSSHLNVSKKFVQSMSPQMPQIQQFAPLPRYVCTPPPFPLLPQCCLLAYRPCTLWSEHVLVVSMEPLDDLSCLTTPGSAVPEMGCCPCR